ncbi:MAG: hypothetical protein Q8T13_23845 [Acidobacteriota bacterium]|nr:hypothetical protein [Acidobacteriota bacterium]
MARPYTGLVNFAGRIEWTQPRALQSWLLRKVGKRVMARLYLISARTEEQLAYWFGVPVKRVAKATGYTSSQAHALMLACCFGVIVDPATGREIPKVPSTGDLTRRQFAALITWVGPWALKTYNLVIPPPAAVRGEDLDGDA